VVLSLSSCCKPTTPSPSILVKLAWILYSIAAPGSLVVILLYWSLDWDGEAPGYYNIMKHGIAGAMVWFDGLVISLIPVRIKHFFIFLVYAIAFLVWSYLHSYYEIGNGTYEDDALYDVLRWNGDQMSALTLSVVVLTVVVPLCYFLVWSLSLASGICKWDGSRRPTVQKGSSSDTYMSMA